LKKTPSEILKRRGYPKVDREVIEIITFFLTCPKVSVYICGDRLDTCLQEFLKMDLTYINFASL